MPSIKPDQKPVCCFGKFFFGLSKGHLKRLPKVNTGDSSDLLSTHSGAKSYLLSDELLTCVSQHSDHAMV